MIGWGLGVGLKMEIGNFKLKGVRASRELLGERIRDLSGTLDGALSVDFSERRGRVYKTFILKRGGTHNLNLGQEASKEGEGIICEIRETSDLSIERVLEGWGSWVSEMGDADLDVEFMRLERSYNALKQRAQQRENPDSQLSEIYFPCYPT